MAIKRKKNPVGSTAMILGLGALAAAYYLTRGGSGGSGGSGDGGGGVGEFQLTLYSPVNSLPATLYVDGSSKGIAIDRYVSYHSLSAGTPHSLVVVFADGMQSAAATVTLSPTGSAGKKYAVQTKDPNRPAYVYGSNTGVAIRYPNYQTDAVSTYTRQVESQIAAGQVERASATTMLGEAVVLVKQRQYETAVAKYAEIISTYPNTPESKSAVVLKAVLEAQLRTATGRAALDRANPLVSGGGSSSVAPSG
jgi:hypothetical protein